MSRLTADRVVQTTCAYCGVGCQVNLHFKDEKLFRVEAPEGLPPNYGALCVKGRYGLSFIESEHRLTHPLLRKNREEPLRPVSWDQALNFTAERLAEIVKAHGPQATAIFSSAKATNEENYLAQKLARAVLKTHNVDHCARLCHSSSTAALSPSLGSAAMSNTIEEVDEAELIMVVGSNTVETHPVIGARIRKAHRRGARLIVVDPRYVGLAENADLWLRVRPGSDVAVFNAMARYLVEFALVDVDKLKAEVDGFSQWWSSVQPYSLHFASEKSGIPIETIKQAAEWYGTSPRAALYWAMGVTQHTHGVDNIQALVNLAVVAGQLGKRGAGLNPLRGQNNVQGAGDMGALPNVFPGYRKVADPAAREWFAGQWRTVLPEAPGLRMTEIMESAGDTIHAIYIVGEDPVTSEPFQEHVKKALSSLDLLIVQDILSNETTPFADVVFPAASFAEKDGTFTNTDRRVQRVRKAKEPPGEAQPDWWIISQMGQRLSGRLGGSREWDYWGPEAIWNEVRRAVPASFGGISYARLERQGVRWPCPTADHPGTEVLFTGRFNTETGRAKLRPAEWRPSKERPNPEYPLILSSGRVLYHWHGGAMSRRSPLDAAYPEAKVEIHPADAARYGIEDGAQVELISRRGRIRMRAEVTERTPEGVVFAPFHFREAPTNRLTNNAYDPVSRIPEYKAAAVRLEPLSKGG